MRVEVGEGRTDHVTTYLSKAGKTGQVFVEDEIEPIVRQLQSEMSNLRRDKAKWYSIDFSMDSSGKFTTNFSYDKPKWMLEAEALRKAMDKK